MPIKTSTAVLPRKATTKVVKPIFERYKDSALAGIDKSILDATGRYVDGDTPTAQNPQGDKDFGYASSNWNIANRPTKVKVRNAEGKMVDKVPEEWTRSDDPSEDMVNIFLKCGNKKVPIYLDEESGWLSTQTRVKASEVVDELKKLRMYVEHELVKGSEDGEMFWKEAREQALPKIGKEKFFYDSDTDLMKKK